MLIDLSHLAVIPGASNEELQTSAGADSPAPRPENELDSSEFATGKGEQYEIERRFSDTKPIEVMGSRNPHGGKIIDWRGQRIWRPTSYSGPDLRFTSMQQLRDLLP